MSHIFSPTNGHPYLQRRQLWHPFRAVMMDPSTIQAPRSPAIAPRSSGSPGEGGPPSKLFCALMTALSLTLLCALIIVIYLLVARCLERRKEKKRHRESLYEVRVAREMKPHDVDLLYTNQSLHSRVGSAMSRHRQEVAPFSPGSQRSNQASFFNTPGIDRSGAFTILPTRMPAHFSNVGVSFPPSERRSSSPIQFPSRAFQLDPRREPSSPTVCTDILIEHDIPRIVQRPAIEVLIPRRASDTEMSSRDVSLFQYPHLQGRSPTARNESQKIVWSYSPAVTEPPLSPCESEASTPSFGFQAPTPPLSPRSQPPVFQSHADFLASSAVAAKQHKLSKSTSALKQFKALGEDRQEMRERPISAADRKTVSTLISEIDALSIEQDRRRRIEGWFDTPGWGEGSTTSARTGRQRQLGGITVTTDVIQNSIGTAF